MTGVDEVGVFNRLRLGSTFANRYDVEALLGAGGMGAVYRVRDRALAEPVALKVLVPPVEGAVEYTALFRQEVKLSRKITHANVVHVYDIGEQNGILFMTMELVDGTTLRKAITNAIDGRLPLAEALRVAHGLASGLAAVHAHGIVHRDLKPGNVMICRTGRVVLTDFGISSQLDGNASIGSGKLLGTMTYMAPEQFLRSGPSFRTDVYAFGLVLFEMLTGSLPIRSNPFATFRVPIEIDLQAAGVVGDKNAIASVEDIVRRCLADDPEQRPGSADDVRRLLQSCMSMTDSTYDARSVGRREMNDMAGRLATSVAPSGEAQTDGTTGLLMELEGKGIPPQIAQAYVTARADSRMHEAARLIAAFERFTECIEFDPAFREAVAHRAVTAVRCWFVDRAEGAAATWEDMANRCVQEAVAVAPDLSATHLAAAMLATQSGEMKIASRSLVRALEIDARSHEAQEYLGMLQCEAGLVDDGLPRLAYAATAQPPRPMPCLAMARCHALFGRHAEADALVAEGYRRFGLSHPSAILYRLRIAAWRNGRHAIKLSISEQSAIRDRGKTHAPAYVDVLNGKASTPEILTWLNNPNYEQLNSRVKLAIWQIGVEMLVLAGGYDEAIQWLRRCAHSGLIDIVWLDRCPLFDPLRGSVEFGEIRNWVWLNAAGLWT